MPKIAIDAMGGDHAPQAVIEGALLAAQDFAVELILVGARDAIEQELAKHRGEPKFDIATSRSPCAGTSAEMRRKARPPRG